MNSDHTQHLLVLTILSRLLFSVLLISSSSFTLFDSSPNIITNSIWSSPLLRWDVFHFAHIAENGYVYEHEWAFFPGTPLIMRFTAEVVRFVNGSPGPLNWDHLLLGGALAAVGCDTTRTLYHLSLHHLGSPSLALMASLLSLIPHSPVTLRFAPYAEPFFTYLSYKGMLCCARSQWLAASVLFCLAGIFRSNGVLLSGFILWGRMVQPVLDAKMPSFKHLFVSVLLTAITFVPFVFHNYAAYDAFCVVSQPASWCSNFPPFVYTHVQSKYWNVGLFRYWTFQQLPNFIISAPPLVSLFYFSHHYVTRALIPQFCSKHTAQLSKKPQESQAQTPQSSSLCHTSFLSLSLSPHVIHAVLLATTFLFASHTQIILRLGPSMPVTYWAAAWLLVKHPRLGRCLISWSVLWSLASVILWGNFLPPA